jgi:hypothetical protein
MPIGNHHKGAFPSKESQKPVPKAIVCGTGLTVMDPDTGFHFLPDQLKVKLKT